MADTLIRAAQYVRMSTEHQRYSIEYQSSVNAQYAARRGYEIVQTYADSGISGLTAQRRPGLQRMLADALGGTPDFAVIIVYDVSRWGRFQDPDESAHYEFVCRAAGVGVEYSAEGFANDGSLSSAIIKTVKRAMAAEYVRELSLKVRTAKRGLGERGYWMGGIAPYGYRRCLIGDDGVLATVLQPGQRKALQGQRVVLVAGPDVEQDTVRRIFRLFVSHGLSYLGISDLLNAEGVPTGYGRPWSPTRIRKMLNDEVYAGTLVMGRHAHHLKHCVSQPRATWRRVPDAVPALVSRDWFDAAQACLPRHRPTASDEELLEDLRAAWRRHGRLSERILQHDPTARSGRIYERRFGSLTAAFERIGYVRSPEQQRMLEKLHRDRPHLSREYWRAYTAEHLLRKLSEVLQARGRLTTTLIDGTAGVPNSGTYRKYFGSLARAYELVGYIPSAHQQQRFKPPPR